MKHCNRRIRTNFTSSEVLKAQLFRPVIHHTCSLPENSWKQQRRGGQGNIFDMLYLLLWIGWVPLDDTSTMAFILPLVSIHLVFLDLSLFHLLCGFQRKHFTIILLIGIFDLHSIQCHGFFPYLLLYWNVSAFCHALQIGEFSYVQALVNNNKCLQFISILFSMILIHMTELMYS